MALRFERAVHLGGELLQELIVSGSVWPGDAPATEAERQLDLNTRNQCLLARSYPEVGFQVVVDFVIVSRRRVDEYPERLSPLSVHLVVLAPGRDVVRRRDATREKSIRHRADRGVSIAERWAYLEDQLRAELGETGLWIESSELTPDATVDCVLASREGALLR